MSKDNKQEVKTSVVPDLKDKFPANHVPPRGTIAYGLSRHGQFWSVWSFRVTETGNIETECLMEREPFALAREKVLSKTVSAHIEAIK